MRVNINPEFARFDAGVRKMLAVSREELKKREEHWKQKKEIRKQGSAPTSDSPAKSS